MDATSTRAPSQASPDLIEDVYATRVDHRFKGFAPATYGRTIRQLIDAGVALFDGSFVPPIMVLRGAALEHNIDAMARYCRAKSVQLAPHGKTTLAPQLFQRQLRAGAWGITVATPAQIALCRASGIDHVLLANELVNEDAIAWVVRELEGAPDFQFCCYVDSTAGVARLDAVLRSERAIRTLPVLVERGYAGGRTGCRTPDEATEVARAVDRSRHLTLRGVAAFEGSIGHSRDEQVLRRVRDFLQDVRGTVADLIRHGLAPPLPEPFVVSVGGSMFFDDVIAILSPGWPEQRPVDVLLRAGCYITHDSGAYEDASPFTRAGADSGFGLEPALAAWGEVLSSPEPGLSLVALGRRDVPFDMGLPVPTAVYRDGERAPVDTSRLTVAALNDQHAYVTGDATRQLQVGDWIEYGISHPCTAMDKWSLLPVVDADHRVVDAIRTFF